MEKAIKKILTLFNLVVDKLTIVLYYIVNNKTRELENMKTKQELIDLYFTNNVTSYKGIKWTDIFNSEEELMDTMYKMKDTRFNENTWIQMLVRYTDNDWELSEKQIKQLKRNAWLVAKLANDNNPSDEHIFC